MEKEKDIHLNFKLPIGSKVDFYIIDCFDRLVIVDGDAYGDGPSCGFWGCRYFLDAADDRHVVRVIQGVIYKIGEVLIVAAKGDEPYRVGKLWDQTAVVIPPRFIKYPKVLPPNTTFKEMISQLQKTVLEELRADLDKVMNCPDLSLPSPQQVEAELKADWKELPADLFRYKIDVSVSKEVRRWKKMERKKREREREKKKKKKEMKKKKQTTKKKKKGEIFIYSKL